MTRSNMIAAPVLALAALVLAPAIAAAQSGPWQHAREPRDRSLSCEALEGEISDIDQWRADSRGGAPGSGIDARQGAAAAEVAARRTGNSRATGAIRDATRLFGGNQQRRQQPQTRAPDPDRVAAERRDHLMGLYQRNNCAQGLGEIDEAGTGPWLAVHMPRDPALSCDGLEAEIGHIDAFIAQSDGSGPSGAGIDTDQALQTGQSVARSTRDYGTSRALGDARRVLGAGGQPAQRRELSDAEWETVIAYDRRDHLMNLFERRDCW